MFTGFWEKWPFWAARKQAAIIFLALMYSCASQLPEEPVAQEESPPAQGERLQEADALRRLQELEEKAKGAIARAETAGAAELSPKLLREAYLDLQNGQEKDPKTDGGAQREQYLSAIQKADQAYDEAVAKSQAAWLLRIDKYESDLDRLNAALYMPKHNAHSRKLLLQLREHIHEGNHDESLALYQFVVPNVDAVVAALAANLDWLDQLRQEVAGLLGEANRRNLQGRAASLAQQGRAAYDSSMEHFIRGDMQNTEEDLFDGRYYLGEALRHSNALDISQIDALLRSVQESLETASQRKAIDEDGNEIEVEPWRGEIYLEQQPLVDLSEQNGLGPRKRNESRLQQPQVSGDFLRAEEMNLSFLRPLSFRAEWELRAVAQEVLENSREGNPFEQEESDNLEERENLTEPEADTFDSTRNSEGDSAQEEGPKTDLLSEAQLLLNQAIRSWENGVRARNQADLPKARHYFEEAARLIDQYSIQYAILGYYTVRKLKPEDCLWCIAGYSDIYGDPFQWTRIYQRNRNIIRNPSLIYPGQRLVIPPPR